MCRKSPRSSRQPVTHSRGSESSQELPLASLMLRAGRRITWLLLVAGTFFAAAFNSPVAAQDEAASGDAAATPAPPPVAEPAAGGESDWERLIYLPYRNLKDVFEKHGSTVFMPYADYIRQWQQGEQPVEQNVVDAVITESHYVASVDRSLLRIKATLTVQVVGRPWVEVPVQFGNAAVGRLTAEDGKQVLLKGTGNGTYALLFGQAGEHQIEIELAASIRTSPDGRQVDFNVPAVGVTTFELAIPEADQTIEVQPHLIALPVDSGADETRIKANLGSTTKISASWHPQTSQKPDMALLAAVTNYQKITLRDGLVHTDAWLNYEILRGEMTEVAIAVPVGHRILGVSSGDAKIRGWRAEPGEQLQTVRVEFLSPATSRVTIEVHTEREFSTDSIQLAGRDDQGNYNGIHAVDAVRESGQITLASASDLSLQYEQTNGLVRIEDAEIHASIRQAGAATFKFFSSSIQLQVLARPVEARLVLNSAYRFTFEDDELKLIADLNFQVERAGVFEFRVNLPDDLVVDRVDSTTGHAVREFHVEGQNPRTLRIVMQQKTGVDVGVGLRLMAHQSFEEASETLELSLPIPEPQVVERETAEVYVSASEALEVITDQEGIEAAQPLPVPPGLSHAGKRIAAAWSFNRRPVEIPVRTRRRPTRLSAQVATTIDIREEIIEVSAELRYLVQYAGLDVFRFAVPEEVSGRLQITSSGDASAPAIKQKVPADEAVDGWVTWTVTMQREVIGPHVFTLNWDTRPDGEDDAAPDGEAAGGAGADASEVVFQTVKVLGLDGSDEKQREVALSSVSGEIAVRKDRSLSVSAKPLDEGLEAIDVRELSLLPQTGSLAYRYFRQPAAIRIASTKHEIQKVVETVVTRALVEVVTRRETQANYRCRYRIRSSERQRLRVDVPGGSELLGVFIDGQQVSPEKNAQPMEVEGWDSYFVNVSRPGSSDDQFSMTLQMMTPVGVRTPFDGWGGRLMLRLPQIGGIESSGVVVQQLQTVIWTPEDYNLLGDTEGFTHETKLKVADSLLIQRRRTIDRLNVDDWIGVPVAGFIDFPTEGNRFRYSSLGTRDAILLTWASQPNYTWLASGSLILIAILLRGLSWDTKLLLMLVAAFAAILFGLSSPGWSAEIVSAARFGIYALVGIWVLHTVFSWKSGRSAPPEGSDDGPSSGPMVGASLPVVIPPPGVFDDLRKQFGN